jgi:hypothetical protein
MNLIILVNNAAGNAVKYSFSLAVTRKVPWASLCSVMVQVSTRVFYLIEQRRGTG